MKKNFGRRLGLWLVAIAITCVVGAGSGNAISEKQALGDYPLPPTVYKKYLKKLPLDAAIALPAYYDARGDGLVTPPKNQGSCGSCWAFATVGAVESHLLKQFDVGPENLSEQQQVSCNTAMFGCDGGSSTAIRYYEMTGTSDGTGPVNEQYFPYTANDTTACMNAVAAQLGYRVTDYHTVTQTTVGFKESLFTYGPSYWRYDVHEDFYTYWNTGSAGSIYVNKANSPVGGHAVLLIGWDDAKGAFLCKNSWGETGGPNGDGTFWIAYGGHANDLGFGMANFSIVSLGCSSDSECDDGLVCNGAESCVNQQCQAGTSVVCEQNGTFCDGTEVCSESSGSCVSSGNPCGADEVCEESADQCVSLCGNGSCDAGEDCSSCPNDCISGPSGGSCDVCFKGKCDGSCNPVKDGADCSDCWSSYCCGDGTCEGAENSENCGIDCEATFCDNGICDYDETYISCPADCPAPTPEICNNTIDDDGDGYTDCADPDCSDDPLCASTCQAFKESCSENADCCSNKCNKGVCR